MGFVLAADRVIDWVMAESPAGLTLDSVYFGIGDGTSAFQIAVGHSSSEPSRTDLKKLHAGRKGKLTINLLVAIKWANQVTIFGPDESAVSATLKEKVAIRFLNSVLSQPNSLLAYQRSISLLRSNQTTSLSGFINNGLFSSYLLREKVPQRPDWDLATKKAKRHEGLRHKQLIESLGFEVAGHQQETLLLKIDQKENQLVAILLDQSENFEGRSARFQASPVEWGLMVATEKKAPWLIALREDQIRLYPARDGVGVGQKSQAETYFEIDLLAVDDEHLAFLELIFSAEALAEGGTTENLLLESHRFATGLGARLRDRVYESVVPTLSVAVASRLKDMGTSMDSAGLDFAYKLTLRILFRLLFQAYAEDRGLLPAGRNERYDNNSLKGWANSFLMRDSETPWGESSSIWFDLLQVWNAIDEGNPQMQVPAYNGGLFGSHPEFHPAGSIIKQLEIRDSDLGPALTALLIDRTEDGVMGLVDFRSLSVREFGTIYEGLLESSLSLAEVDLTVDRAGAWVPALENQIVLAPANSVYFHNASGERKATGSYYTPAFVVDHLMGRSVEPAIKAHLEKIKIKLENNDQSGAYRDFFDFRVADLAMGSGHFLVAAIDRIEMHMRAFLSHPDNFIPGVVEEMERLESVAKEMLGLDVGAFEDIERSSLLRRQIARRCIYGLDINELAVELSRLAIWIHTFVPGLPMSSLDHNLVCANSLTGIATIDEALDALIPNRNGQVSFFDDAIEEALLKSKDLLSDVAIKAEATKMEVKEAAIAAKLAKEQSVVAKNIFDVAVAARLGVVDPQDIVTTQDIESLSSIASVSSLIEQLQPAHLPYLFPEVFLRKDPGFDALVGNPPFQEAIIEELEFWMRRFPGLKGRSSTEQKALISRYREDYPDLRSAFELEQDVQAQIRLTLSRGPFPGMGTGDPDLYKAFAWRFQDLCRVSGKFALVLPNSIWNTKGNSLWRKATIEAGLVHLVLVINTDTWVFENVNVGYRFTFVSLDKALEPQVVIQGTFSSRREFDVGILSRPIEIPSTEILKADEEATIPALSSILDFTIWQKLISHPVIGDGRLEGGRQDIICAPMREIDSSLDGKRRGIFTNRDSDHPVYNHLNVGNLNWEPNLGAFNYSDFASYSTIATREMKSLRNRSGSAYSLISIEDSELLGHPLTQPRIVMRDVVHASNKRKVWVSLAPKNTLLTNSAPYLIFKNTELIRQAYLIGLLASRVVDWFGHSRIGLHLNFFIFYTIPVPIWNSADKRMIRIGELAAGLSIAGAGDFGEWSKLAKPIMDQSHRLASQAEIDAIATLLFELNEAEVSRIYENTEFSKEYIETVGVFREKWAISE
jgi:hypothetical protein